MSSEMEKLLMEEESRYQEVYKGSIVKGKVMIEKEDSFYVDLNYKTDGILPKDQILDTETVSVGDEITIQVIKIDKNTGDILLSKRKVDEFKVWDDIEIGHIIPVKIVETNAKGLIGAYKNSVRGFIPLSHIELKFIGEEVLKSYVGKTFEVEVIDVDPKKRRLILSRKNILLKQQQEMRKEIEDQIVEGATFEGTIKDIKDYGVFVDIGGITGLVHVSEISWDRSDNIRDLYKNEDKVMVQVINYDKEKDRLSLSIKSLIEHPWDKFMADCKVSDIVKGEVKNIKEYGAFINLHPTVDGFVHISNLSSEFIKNPGEILKVGQEVEVRIMSIDEETKKIELSLILEEKDPGSEESTEAAVDQDSVQGQLEDEPVEQDREDSEE